MSHFICPVCAGALDRREGSLACGQGHSFDLARSGYVNLLLSGSARQHGDDGEMARARRDFLDRGYYLPLLEGLAAAAAGTGERPVVLDAGCGECWYTAGILERLQGLGRAPAVLGVDLSKQALQIGGRRSRDLELAVASVFRLPVADGSCDGVLSVFAPVCPGEFARVLRPGGLLLRAFPLEDHLWELKEAVYDRALPNEGEEGAPAGFAAEGVEEVRSTLCLTRPEDIRNLFAMTPYAHKTGRRDLEKLQALEALTVRAAFGIAAYRRLP